MSEAESITVVGRLRSLGGLGGANLVELIKDSKYSFALYITRDEASLLYDYLENLNKKSISILFNGNKVDFEIVIDEIEYSLIICDKSIKLYMDNEEIQFFKHQLNEVIEGRDFYPSELCERKMKNKNITICCFAKDRS